jgi:RHS repeat-associated protein
VGDLAYTYDAAGHRTSVGGSLARVSLPAALTTATYDAANRLTAWDALAPAYDVAGEMTSDGTSSYTWNARGELVEVKQGPTTIAAYAYDAFGRRTTKTLSGATTRFAYDGANVIEEQDGAGSPTADLLTGGIDQTFRRTDSAGSRYFLTDALGSTVALTDGTGAITTGYTYEPFGKTTVSGETSSNAFAFTGRENDGALYYYRARYLQPAFGRFLSEDPIGFAAGDPNLNAYVGDNPVNLSDPSGRIAPLVVVGVGCAAGVIAYGLVEIGSNILGGRKLLEGVDPIDAGISCAAGAIGGIIGGPGWTLLERAVVGSVTGFDATLAGQAYHGTGFDPLGAVLGTAGGGVGSIVPVPAPQTGYKAFFLTVGVGVGQELGQTGLETLIKDFISWLGWQ